MSTMKLNNFAFSLYFSEILSDFLNCVPKVVGSSASPVRIAKLKCIRRIACSDLFKDPSTSFFVESHR